MASPDRSVRTHRHLRRYVLADEQVVLATRLHWAKLIEPVATTLAVTVLVAWLHSTTGSAWVWVLWLVAAVRCAVLLAQWQYEWFVATDKRLLLTYGFIVQKVAMMPLTKVTDMSYSRLPIGQILGYGRFVMESAGQDQALSRIDFVPDADRTYRTLCGTIFLPRRGPQHGGQGAAGRADSGVVPLPPAVPPASREPRPTTAELPVVDPPQEAAGHATSSRAMSSDRSGASTANAHPWSEGDFAPPDPGRRNRGRRAQDEPSRYALPPTEGPGATVPKPFL